MYNIDERDRVVAIDTVPHASTGSAEPRIVADESTVALRYATAESDQDEGDLGIQMAIVRFESCWAHYFGSPNSEALHGHPLYGRGLTFYGIFEVLDSSWIRLMEKRNRVHQHHSPARYAELRHFIFTFNDSTFECVAESVTSQTALWRDAEVLWVTILDRRR